MDGQTRRILSCVGSRVMAWRSVVVVGERELELEESLELVQRYT